MKNPFELFIHEWKGRKVLDEVTSMKCPKSKIRLIPAYYFKNLPLKTTENMKSIIQNLVKNIHI